MYKAMFYKKMNRQLIQCVVCEHRCVVAEGKTGICRVRKNSGNELFSLTYGRLAAEHIDPIEKKPLFHFLPGTFTYSIATVGCNFTCAHCQNADISQYVRTGGAINGNANQEVRPSVVVQRAKATHCPSISYTYTEPTIFVEFALETMKLARAENLKNVWVSNGYFSNEVFAAIAPYLDAINIDLKFFKEESYKKICGARLAPVLKNIKLVAGAKIHQEITTLIIPGINDNEEELHALAKFIADLDGNIPWHVTAFYPAYKMSALPPASRATLLQAQKIGKQQGVRYVYLGNL